MKSRLSGFDRLENILQYIHVGYEILKTDGVTKTLQQGSGSLTHIACLGF